MIRGDSQALARHKLETTTRQWVYRVAAWHEALNNHEALHFNQALHSFINTRQVPALCYEMIVASIAPDCCVGATEKT